MGSEEMRQLQKIVDSIPASVREQARDLGRAEMRAWSELRSATLTLTRIYQLVGRPDMLELLSDVVQTAEAALAGRREMMDSVARAALDGRIPGVGG